jgi:xanthine/CO dehydrogenase XdhC/CoxF family maturation factor
MEITFSVTPSWRRSTKCVGGECVEVMVLDDAVAMRDSKNPDAGALRFDRGAWSQFLAAVRDGELGAR